MELKEVLLKRRSVRQFSDEPVSEEMIHELLEAGFSGPSAVNCRPWEFYVIESEEVLAKLRAATRFSNIPGKLAIIVCGNLDNALEGGGAEFWVQDCSAATENMLLRATDLGLGAVWCGLYPSKERADLVRSIIGTPARQIPLNILYFGHPSVTPAPRSQWEDEKIHFLK